MQIIRFYEYFVKLLKSLWYLPFLFSLTKHLSTINNNRNIRGEPWRIIAPAVFDELIKRFWVEASSTAWLADSLSAAMSPRLIRPWNRTQPKWPTKIFLHVGRTGTALRLRPFPTRSVSSKDLPNTVRLLPPTSSRWPPADSSGTWLSRPSWSPPFQFCQ